MHRVRTILKKANLGKDGSAPIYVEYLFDRENRTLIKTGKRVSPIDWNDSKGEVKRSNEDCDSINQFIGSIKRRVESIADNAVLRGNIPTVDYVKTNLEKSSTSQGAKSKLSDLLDEWIDSKTDSVSKPVITDYRALKRHLLEFASSKRKRLSVLDLNDSFYEQFIKYLQNDVDVGKGKMGMMKSTVGKQVKNLKVFLRYCMKHEYIQKDELGEFKKPSEESDNVYATEAEIDRLMALDLRNDVKLDVVRDVFVVGCETGLRYSDLSKLTSDHITDGLIRKPVRKSVKKVVIPVSKRLQQVIDKNHGLLPKPPNGNSFNERIKDVCRLAGIDTNFSRMIQRGNRKEEISVPKYMVISSHTCRRSFCTNQFLRGMPALLIRKISGHATEKAFLKYIKIDEEKAAEEMARMWKGMS